MQTPIRLTFVVMNIIAIVSSLNGCTSKAITSVTQNVALVDESGVINPLSEDGGAADRLQSAMNSLRFVEPHVSVSLNGRSAILSSGLNRTEDGNIAGICIWPHIKNVNDVVRYPSGIWASFVNDDWIWVRRQEQGILHSLSSSKDLPVEGSFKRLVLASADHWAGVDDHGTLWVGSLRDGVSTRQATTVEREQLVTDLAPTSQDELITVSLNDGQTELIQTETGQTTDSTNGVIAWPFYVEPIKY